MIEQTCHASLPRRIYHSDFSAIVISYGTPPLLPGSAPACRASSTQSVLGHETENHIYATLWTSLEHSFIVLRVGVPVAHVPNTEVVDDSMMWHVIPICYICIYVHVCAKAVLASFMYERSQHCFCSRA
jgi:hypothetical protein